MQTKWKSHSPKIAIVNSFLFVLPEIFFALEKKFSSHFVKQK